MNASACFRLSIRVATAGLILVSSASAGVVEISPGLPPGIGSYVAPAAAHACFVAGGGLTCLEQANLGSFSGISLSFPGGNELASFNAVLTAQLTLNGNPLGPVSLSGPVQVEVFGRPTDSTLGTFNTEMLSMNLTGAGLLIRESPTLASTGQTTIAPDGGGLFQISSFFDIFTELSLDGGATWTPAQAATHVDLTGAPEPASLLLIGAGMMVLATVRRRSR